MTSLEDIIKIRSKVSSNVIVPIIAISNKTGLNLDLLKQMFNLIPSRLSVNNNSSNPESENPKADLVLQSEINKNEDVLMFIQNTYQV